MMNAETKQKFDLIEEHSNRIIAEIKDQGLQFNDLTWDEMHSFIRYYFDSGKDGNILFVLGFAMYVEGYKRGIKAEQERSK